MSAPGSVEVDSDGRRSMTGVAKNRFKIAGTDESLFNLEGKSISACPSPKGIYGTNLTREAMKSARRSGGANMNLFSGDDRLLKHSFTVDHSTVSRLSNV